jgi:hypothetical protein
MSKNSAIASKLAHRGAPKFQPKAKYLGREQPVKPRSKSLAKRSFGGAPKRPAAAKDPAHYRSKVSVAMPPDDLAWVTAEAKRRNLSVSAVFQVALHALRQDRAWDTALATLGTDDITDDDMQALYAEWRKAGLKV